MAGTAPHRERFWLALAAAAALALVLRLAYLAELNGTPVLAGLMGDSRSYDAWAQQIASGEWIGTQVFYQTPLYPYVLAIIYKIGGHDLGLVRLVQVVLGVASCALLGLAGRRFFSARVGLIAASLLAVYPAAIFFDGLIQKSSLDIFLVSLLLWLLAEFQAGRDWRWLAAAGVAAAAFVLNRENARALYPVVGVWLLFGFRDVRLRRRVLWSAVVAAASLAVLLPVGFRNYLVGGEFLVSTSQLGPNFYIGNNPNASGSYEPLVPERGDPLYERDDAARLASKAAGRALSPGEVSDYWLGQAFAYIRSQPLHWLALLGKKVLLTLNAAELPDTESLAAYADYSRILRGLGWLTLGVMLPLAAFGVWASRGEWRRLLILYGSFAALVLAVALFYVVARYRHPLVPIVLLFVAAGVDGLIAALLSGVRRTPHPFVLSPSPLGNARGDRELAERSKDERIGAGHARRAARRQQAAWWPDWRRTWVPGFMCAGLVAVVSNFPFHVVHDETYLNLGSLLVQSGRPADALPLLLKAAALDPEYAEPHFRLGLAHRDAGEQQAAIEELTSAVHLNPEHADAHNALGVLLRGQNKSSEALAQFREAVRYAPDSVEAHSNLGLALMEAGRLDEAIDEHRQAVRLAPGSPGPHNNLAMALYQSGDLGQAIAEYEKALALDPENAEAHGNLALAEASTRSFDGALRHFREAIRLQPSNPQIRIGFGNALCEAGNLAGGIEQYEAAARLTPDSIEAWYLAAQAYAGAGRSQEALARLERALAVAKTTGQADAAQRIDEAMRQMKKVAR